MIRRWWKRMFIERDARRDRYRRQNVRWAEFPRLFQPTPLADEAAVWLHVDRYFEHRTEDAGPKE